MKSDLLNCLLLKRRMPTKSAKIPDVRLANGVLMPQFGLGTFLTKPGELETAIFSALDAGYRHIDTAEMYENEHEIGDALQKYFKTGKLTRKDVFITTKLHYRHNRPEDVEPTLRQSLKDLKTDYIDLYLIHLPVSYNHAANEQDKTVILEDVWRKLVEYHKQGWVRAIGVSNFNNEQIARLNKIHQLFKLFPGSQFSSRSSHFFPTSGSFQLLSKEWNLYDGIRSIRQTTKQYFRNTNCLGSPGRSTFFEQVGQKTGKYDEQTDPLKSKTVNELAQRYRKTPAQILLRHLLQKGFILIPKSTNDKRIRENIDFFDFELTKDDMRRLNEFPTVSTTLQNGNHDWPSRRRICSHSSLKTLLFQYTHLTRINK
ncbi:Aldo-ket-red domain-containing protein [Aphelenchoides bicaudatus]|nr:Aldo-ket-red domain-containing protein [Aphelenchoides bicaudatus]